MPRLAAGRRRAAAPRRTRRCLQPLLTAALVLAQVAPAAADEAQALRPRGFYISALDAPEPFDVKKLGTEDAGERDTLEFKRYITYEGGRISPWHEVPFSAGEWQGEKLLHFVCEIPKGTTAKMEVNKEADHNPIIQDTKKGKLRYYKYHPEVGSLVNYGAIAQTWEHPEELHSATGAGGDNDPIDVLQLNEQPCQIGDVMAVRVLGVFALVDDGETDWKVLVVRAHDPDTAHLQDVGDVPSQQKSELIEWFRRYKTAEGKGLNKFGLDEKVMDKSFAMKICMETHVHWRMLRHSMGSLVPEAAAPVLGEAVAALPQLKLSEEELQWVHVLSEGWATPLDGFMTESQLLQSLHYEHLVIGEQLTPMPVPIVKACTAEEKDQIKGRKQIALTWNGDIIAVMENPEVYEHRKEERAGRTVGITHAGHPYIKMIMEAGDWLVGGRIRVLKPVRYGDGMDDLRKSPAALRATFEQLGADAVFVFQLRNPIHNGHALLMSETARKLKEQGYKKPVLWISPLGGWTKDDDVPLDVRIAQHKAVMGIFGGLDTVLSIFPSPMLYAGPREVLWHAYARMNAGATHYIVGRDPAGMKHPGTNEDLYEMWHGQKMLQMMPGLHRIKLLPFTFAAYDKKAGRMDFFDPKRKEDFESISGSKMRKLARTGQDPPPGFMEDAGWKLLVDFYRSKEQ